MNREAIAKQLRTGWLLTLLLSPVSAFFAVQLALFKQSGSFKPNTGILVLGIMGAFFAALLVLSAATVFFNLYPGVRSEKSYRIFTWFLAPLLLSIVMITQSDSADDLDMWIPFLAMALPFYCIHTWFFIRFVKAMDRLKKEMNNTEEQTAGVG